MIDVIRAEDRRLRLEMLEEMHRQRRRVFVDRLGWTLSVVGDKEIDAYDGPEAIYLLCIDAGRLTSSARLLPTTGPHLMSELFPALCAAGVPRGPGVWEISRFCVNPDVSGRNANRAQLFQIIAAVLEMGLVSGIDTATFIAGKALLPLALCAGWQTRLLGPSVPDGKDRITAVAADITPDGLDAVCARHGLMRPLIEGSSEPGSKRAPAPIRERGVPAPAGSLR